MTLQQRICALWDTYPDDERLGTLLYRSARTIRAWRNGQYLPHDPLMLAGLDARLAQLEGRLRRR